MKKLLYILLILAFFFVGFNLFQIEFNKLSSDRSKAAVASILAGLSAATLVGILLVSLKIHQRLKNKN